MKHQSSQREMMQEQESAGQIEGDDQDTESAKDPSEADIPTTEPGADTDADTVGSHSSDWADLNDRYLRLAAEFENHRKRTAREWSGRVQSANSELLLDLLDIVDNFERAVHKEHDESAYATGVRMILQQLQTMLQKWGVESMQVLGATFDPSQHEALMHVPSDTETEGTVCQEIRKGYVMHDRVLRAAQVAVSKGAPDSE